MPQCKYHEVCGLDALENTDEELCILHSQLSTKDKNSFNKALEAHRNKNGCNYSHLFFPEKADFYRTEFFKEANFTNAIFKESANFSSATFLNGVDFSGAEFLGEGSVKFNRVTFTGFANFVGAAFFNKDIVDFLMTTFTKEASFNGTTFHNAVYFYHTVFSEAVDFKLTLFGDRASFKGAIFTKGGNFDGAEFLREVDFSEARFQEKTIFAGKEKNGMMFPIFSGTQVDFSRAIGEPPGALSFRDADLTKCSFLGMDLRNVEFAGVSWSKIIKGLGCFQSKRIGVYDEVSLPKGETNSLPHIEKLYRELKQNYEDRRDYERAGDFHYGEKEMRRKAETSWGLWCWLTLYWLVSGYGERWIRPLLWAAVLLISSAFGYLWYGLVPKGTSSRMVMTDGWDFLKSLHYSLRVMTLLKPYDLVPVGFGKVINTVQMLLGPIIIGLFALALRQRLKR